MQFEKIYSLTFKFIIGGWIIGFLTFISIVSIVLWMVAKHWNLI